MRDWFDLICLSVLVIMVLMMVFWFFVSKWILLMISNLILDVSFFLFVGFLVIIFYFLGVVIMICVFLIFCFVNCMFLVNFLILILSYVRCFVNLDIIFVVRVFMGVI